MGRPLSGPQTVLEGAWSLCPARGVRSGRCFCSPVHSPLLPFHAPLSPAPSHLQILLLILSASLLSRLIGRRPGGRCCPWPEGRPTVSQGRRSWGPRLRGLRAAARFAARSQRAEARWFHGSGAEAESVVMALDSSRPRTLVPHVPPSHPELSLLLWARDPPVWPGAPSAFPPSLWAREVPPPSKG